MTPDFLPVFNYNSLQLVIRASGGGLWDYDISHDILKCSEQWYKILGIDPSAYTVSNIADFTPFIHKDDIVEATRIDMAEINRLIELDERYHVQFRIVRPSGEVRWIRSVASLVDQSREQTIRAVGCITDITDFRTASWLDGIDARPINVSPIISPARNLETATTSKLTARGRECLL